MKSHYVMQNVFGGYDVQKRSIGYSNQTGNQNYLSQTILMLVRPSILPRIMISSIDESKTVLFFAEIVKQSCYCILENFC